MEQKDLVLQNDIPVKEKQSGQYLNKTIRYQDIKEDRYIVAKVVAQKSGMGKSLYKKNEDGTPAEEQWFVHILDVLTPQLGVVSMWGKKHTSYAFNNSPVGSIVKVVGVTRKTQKGASYKSIEVLPHDVPMTDEVVKEFVDAIKSLPPEERPDEETIRSTIVEKGFTRREDQDRVLAALK